MARWSESAFLRSQNEAALRKELAFRRTKANLYEAAPGTSYRLVTAKQTKKPPPPSPPPSNQPVLDFRARSTPADDSLEKLPLWNCVRRFRAGGAHAFFLVHDPHLGRRQPSTLKAHPASIRRCSTSNFLILSTKRPLSDGPTYPKQTKNCAKCLPFADRQKRIYLRQLLASLSGWIQQNPQR